MRKMPCRRRTSNTYASAMKKAIPARIPMTRATPCENLDLSITTHLLLVQSWSTPFSATAPSYGEGLTSRARLLIGHDEALIEAQTASRRLVLLWQGIGGFNS